MLKIENICVQTPDSEILKGFSLELPPKTVVGLTGRSGAGKTTLLRAILGFLNYDCRLTSGRLELDGEDITKMGGRQRRALCGTTIGYIPQSPMTAFDPRMRIGSQMEETLRIRLKLSRAGARERAQEVLKLVNLTDAPRILEAAPSQLSGGMLQRIAMALLLAMKPKYILADEPTSALDIENRNLLLELLKEQCSDAGILLISHDVEAMEQLCENVAVLDDGRVVEQGTMRELLEHPKEPWTRAYAESYHKRGKEGWTWKELQ